MITGSFKNAIVPKYVLSPLEPGTTSNEVDLGRPYERVLIKVPTINSAQVGITASETTGGTFYPLYFYQPEAATSSQWLTTAGTGLVEVICEHLGGFQFIKITTSNAQTTAAVTFRVCGVRC